MHTRYQGFTIITSLLLLIVVSTLLALGVWQLSRMLEKQAQLADIAKVNEQQIKSLDMAMENMPLAAGEKVAITGRVASERIWLLDNQFYENRLGYKVLAAVGTNRGDMLVDFGWVQGSKDRSVFPEVTLSDSLDSELAVVTYPGVNRFVDNQYVDTQEFGETELVRVQAVDTQEYPFVLTLLGDSEQFARFWIPVVMPPEKHLGYAIQWFGLAIAAAVIGFLALRKR